LTVDRTTNDLDLLVGKMKSAASPLRQTLCELHEKYAPLTDGRIADYIPELAKASPEWFGISIVTVDGRTFEVGDSQRLFTIQSVSKPLMYGLALEDNGVEAVLARVGVEPTGEAFNAILLDEASNRAFNPMVNSGAIVVSDLIAGDDFPRRLSRMLAMFSAYTGRAMHIDNAVFLSERATGHRNRAIAHLMRNFGMISGRMEESLELYFQQCSVLVHALDLATIGATLAGGGVNPLTRQAALRQDCVKYVLSVMHSCGMYDYAGEWAFRVGMPAKSGVGGGILAVVPGVAGIGVFSPPLDAKGNSLRGIKVCEDLSRTFGLHAFESGFAGQTLAERMG
jgi:glutaminase